MEKRLPNYESSGSMWPVEWHGLTDEPVREHEPKAPAAPDARQKPAPQGEVEMSWSLSQSAEPPACATEPVQTEYPAVALPRIQPPKLPDWFWNRVEKTVSIADLSAAENVKPAPKPPADVESRMERLRGLFTDVGLTDLARNYGSLSHDEPRPEIPQSSLESPSSDVIASPTGSPVSKEPEPVAATSIAAKPEIPSSREFIPLKEPESKSHASSAEKCDGGEIRILPAKRGQYGSR